VLHRLSIKYSAPLLFGVPVLALGLCLSAMWNRQAQQAVVDLADQSIEQIHSATATKVADVLSMPVRVCQVNEDMVRSGKLDPSDLAAWRRTFVKQSSAFDMLSAISWGDAEGRSAWVSRYADGVYYWALKDDPTRTTMYEWRLDENGEIGIAPTNEFDFHLFSRPWYTTPREARSPCWSDPFVWVGGGDSDAKTLGISYGIPIFAEDGEFLGVIDADYSLNDLSSYLATLKIGRSGMAVLATRDGHLLAASNDTPIIGDTGERVNAYHSPDRLIAAAAKFIGEAESVKGAHAEIDVRGEVHYLRASPVGKEVGLDWTLVTVVPERDFTEQIETGFKRSWLTSLIAVLLAVGVGFGAARWLVAPLLKLVTAVRRIGQGDLDTRVRLRHAPEYANLADEINKMTAGLKDRMRMQKSLSLAMEVQRNLLPSEAPAIAGLDVAGHSTYCDETGGDYFDFLDVSPAQEDTAVIVIGDVMGHGVAAALLMATARGILRSRSAIPGSLGDFLEHLNDMLVVDTNGERFMTMLLATVSAGRDELRWASAGHGPPLIYDAANDTFPELTGGGLPLGLVAGETYEEHVQGGIQPGTIVLASTDGLSETMDVQGKQFGSERLLQILRAHARKSAAEISEIIRNALAEHRGGLAQDDDLTFVVAKVL